MASQADLQELLRLLVGRKMTMMAAMGQVKALQAANLRSIQQIAEAPLSTVEGALNNDSKAAKSLQSACKAHIKKQSSGGSPASKRPSASSDPLSPSSKRPKGMDGSTTFFGGPSPADPSAYEASLVIPVPTPDEVPDSELSKVRLLTNRAPVVLAFATELLRYTMPEQPPSARLSLAQAVVSANSRSKAVSIGIAQSSAEQEGYGEGQPVVRVMGREIRVLKRGGYDWKGDERRGEEEGWAGEVDLATRNEMERRAREERDRREAEELQRSQSQESATLTEPSQQQPSQPAVASWSTSPTLSLKASTFVGRATTFAVSPGTSATAAATALVRRLLETNPHLQTATHNAWAYRCVNPNLRSSSSAASRILEDSFDDGETGAGALLLRVLRDAGVEDALVLMTRWWGGIFLGPDRFRLMRTVAVEALAARNRVVSGGGDGGGGAVGLGLPGGEALWGLDLEAMRSAAKAPAQHASRGREDIVRTGLGDMHIHRPEPARAYLMKSFASAPSPDVPATGDGQSTKLAAKKKTPRELEAEAAHNASLLTAALRRLFDSWADHVTADELDRRAWQWYIAVRPDVADGRAGWGAKGVLDLGRILALRRSE